MVRKAPAAARRIGAAGGGDSKYLGQFDDFSVGEYGILGGQHAPKGSWTGRNLVKYVDGSVGPRPGLFDITPGNGLANGVVQGLMRAATTPEVAFIQGINVKGFDASSAGDPVFTFGTLAITPTRPVDWFPDDQTCFITVFGDKSYVVDFTTYSVGAATGSPGGNACCRYGDRYLVGGISGNGNRLRISDPANKNSWPATNFIDIGDSLSIRALIPLRDFLVIIKSDGTIYILTGVPTVNETVRKHAGPATGMTKGSFPVGVFLPSRAAADLGGTRIWLADLMKDATVGSFTGAKLQFIDQLALGDADPVAADIPPVTVVDIPPNVGLAPTDQPESVVVMDKAMDNGFMRRRGCWTAQQYGQAVTGFVIPSWRGSAIVCDGGAVGATPKFWLLPTHLDSPPLKQGVVRGLKTTGVTINYAFAPDTAGISPVGDIEVRAEVAMNDWTPAALMTLVSKWDTVGNNRSWRLDLDTTGKLVFHWSNDGTVDNVATSSIAIPSATAVDGRRLWVRANIDVDNGAAGRDVKFFYGTDGVNWTQLGATQTSATVTSIADKAARMTVAALFDAGSSQPVAGVTYRAQLYSGLGGITLLADAKFQTPTAPATDGPADNSSTTWTDSIGNVWTRSGASFLLRSDTINGSGVSVGDATDTAPTADIDLPETWADKPGEQFMVRHVEVEFVSYKTGTADTNHMDVSVAALGVFEDPDESDNVSPAVAFDEANSSSAVAGTRRMKRFSFADHGWGEGYQVRIRNVRGCRVKRVMVRGAVKPARAA